MTDYYDWKAQARPEQLPPEHDNWFVWAQVAGRGYGKTRAMMEWVREKALEPNHHMIFIGKNIASAQSILVNGASGIMKITPNKEKPFFSPSRHLLQWPSGSTATLLPVKRARDLRGPEADILVADDIDQWTLKLFRQALMTTRVGPTPHILLSMTPGSSEVLDELEFLNYKYPESFKLVRK